MSAKQKSKNKKDGTQKATPGNKGLEKKREPKEKRSDKKIREYVIKKYGKMKT